MDEKASSNMRSKTSGTPEAAVEIVQRFAKRTGKGIRIAVIDSGVNMNHPHIIVKPVAGASVGAGGEFNAADFTDHLGHGTAVMAAIQEKAPEAEYIAIKLFDASLRTRTEYLLSAIDWALQKGVHLINLSLGTVRLDFADAFNTIVRDAAAKGTILLAAREALGREGNATPCLPGCLPGVLGVGLDWDCPRHRYRVKQSGSSVFFCASGYPRPLPGRPAEKNLNGISFAVANITGFAARACEAAAAEQNPIAGLTDLQALLLQSREHEVFSEIEQQ